MGRRSLRISPMPKFRSCFSTFRPRKATERYRQKAIEGLKKLEPSPLATRDRVAYIDAANYEQHLEQLRVAT